MLFFGGVGRIVVTMGPEQGTGTGMVSGAVMKRKAPETRMLVLVDNNPEARLRRAAKARSGIGRYCSGVKMVDGALRTSTAHSAFVGWTCETNRTCGDGRDAREGQQKGGAAFRDQPCRYDQGCVVTMLRSAPYLEAGSWRPRRPSSGATAMANLRVAAGCRVPDATAV